MLGVLGFGLAAVVLLFLPFLDRGAAEGRSSKLVTVAGVARADATWSCSPFTATWPPDGSPQFTQ